MAATYFRARFGWNWAKSAILVPVSIETSQNLHESTSFSPNNKKKTRELAYPCMLGAGAGAVALEPHPCFLEYHTITWS